MVFNVGSLFAGVGGVCLGFQRASDRFKLAVANEIDEKACETYRLNFDHVLIPGDIEKILDPELEEEESLRQNYVEKNKQLLSKKIDILTAGFPCQAFSIAGNREGFQDRRGELFFSVIRTIKSLKEKPRVLFLENVKNLVGHDRGRTFEIIKQSLEAVGYNIKYKVLNTYKVTDLPQNRERLIIVGFLNTVDYDNFTFFEDIVDKVVSKDEILENVKKHLYVEKKFDVSKYYYNKEKYPHYFMSEEECTNGSGINLEDVVTENYEFYQVRRGMYVRKNMSGVCPTLTANMGTGGHNVPLIKVSDGIRKLTPSECFNLQGFGVSDRYKLPDISDSHLYKQAGNSVSVDLVQLIAKSILETLDKNIRIKR